jgi:class 3 adenylate cyclase
VRAAVAAQRALAEHPWTTGEEVRVRMALHTGEPEVSAEGYVGLGVHRAARICSAGHGGQILLSRSTAGVFDEDEIPGVTLKDLGDRRLKDLDRAERIYQVVADGLRRDFPALNTVDREERERKLVEAVKAAELPSGTLTFLFTDAEDFTRLIRSLPRNEPSERWTITIASFRTRSTRQVVASSKTLQTRSSHAFPLRSRVLSRRRPPSVR